MVVIKKMVFMVFCFAGVIFGSDSTENGADKATSTGDSIVIAVRESDFKNALAESIENECVDMGFEVLTINDKELKDTDPDNYYAVIILNEFRAFHLNRHTKRFFKNNGVESRDNVVMISTAGNPDKFKSDWEGVDAVSAASDMSTIDTLTEWTIQRIE